MEKLEGSSIHSCIKQLLIAGVGLIFTTFAVGEVDSNVPSPCDKRQVECVNAVVEAIIAADNAGDVNGVLSYYDDNAVLISPAGADVIGKENIQAHYRKLFAKMQLQIETDIIETIVSGDWAISRGVNTVRATYFETSETAATKSKFLMTLRHDLDNGWRIVHLMWNNQDFGAD